MSVEFSCRECGRPLRVNKSAIGRRIRCPDCATLLTVPERADSANDVIDDLEILPDEEPESEAAELPPPLDRTACCGSAANCVAAAISAQARGTTG